jgi:hypothetical protein
VDARPSDAIALAVGGDVPIFVSESVIDEIEQAGGAAGLDPPGPEDPMDEDGPEWA